MAFMVQDDTGTVVGANAYVSVAYFKAYHDDRGNDYSGYSDVKIQQALVRTKDYVDTRFQYRGERANEEDAQSTEWPRVNCVSRDGDLVYGIPTAIKEASCEYGLRALSATLEADPDTNSEASVVREKYTKVGPIEERFSFLPGGTQRPRYPLADQKILKAGLTESGIGRFVVRG